MRRPWALPLVPLYWAGLKVDQAFTRERRLGWPVVSVGSLSAGGAGKTPVVKMLAALLERHGVEVDVLTRGYGRRSRGVERVAADGEAGRFGDEPVELARAGLRVFVGADRFAAGRLAEASGGARIHLLDDGFQHRALLRDLNVALVTLEDVRDWLLPAGNLREPQDALTRADVLVVREDELEKVLERVPRSASMWVIRRRMVVPDFREKCLGFCGLGRPKQFFSMLRHGGCQVGDEVTFADHHAYGEADARRLVIAARRCGASAFVTTRKDFVKLTEVMRVRMGEVGPVYVAELRVELVDEGAALKLLEPLMALCRTAAP